MKYTADYGKAIVKLIEKEAEVSDDPFDNGSVEEARSPYAKIISLGKGCEELTSAKEGDEVIISQHGGQEIEVDGESYLIIIAGTISAFK